MFLNIEPIILPGQVYTNPDIDDSLIVITKTSNGAVSFFGIQITNEGCDKNSYRGKMEASEFVIKCQALMSDSIVAIDPFVQSVLLRHCPADTFLMEGFVVTDEMLEDENDEFGGEVIDDLEIDVVDIDDLEFEEDEEDGN